MKTATTQTRLSLLQITDNHLDELQLEERVPTHCIIHAIDEEGDSCGYSYSPDGVGLYWYDTEDEARAEHD